MSKRMRIVGLGEVLWDVFPDGPKFGGAPANFACSAGEMVAAKADIFMVSAIGKDELGAGARQSLAEHGVRIDYLIENERPTGRVDVTLDSAGIASYVFAENVAWDDLRWTPEHSLLAQETDIVCFGTLGQRSPESRKVIQQFVWATPRSALRVFDINLRSPYWTEEVILESLKLANVLKLNDAELPILAKILHLKGGNVELLKEINRLFSLKLSALTSGSSGSLLVAGSGETSDLLAEPTTVVDTVGAGDAFAAAMTIGMFNQLPLNTINHWASRVAAFVCSKPGAAPHLPDSVKLPLGAAK
jgi:fructokinase